MKILHDNMNAMDKGITYFAWIIRSTHKMFKKSTSGLYYKSFTIVNYDCKLHFSLECDLGL